MPKAKPLAALLLLALTAEAQADVGDRWPLLGFAGHSDCRLAIASSGRAMQIRATGLIPGETLRLVIANGDMKPIALSPRAGDDGALMRYYFPFRLNRDGGLVDVTVAGARCTLTASAPWTRNLATIP
ncbi:hypothetical protein [Novosphingobium sp.]|uniref:hypothetical protein n=1 Tax=Novosphingobium sp. TaxID=1874826 RepID=UPI00286C3B51|nr:hypothetical protein [Novosphingobium sp.]